MAEVSYPRDRTALLLVDPKNDFLSEGGKVYPRIKPIADQVIQVVIVPHWRWEPGDHEDWDFPNPRQPRDLPQFSRAANGANGTRTLRRSPDVIAKEHWAERLCHFLLKQKGITHDGGQTARQYLHRIDRPVCNGTRLPRDAGVRRYHPILARDDARRPRTERPYLCPLDHDNRRGERGSAGAISFPGEHQ